MHGARGGLSHEEVVVYNEIPDPLLGILRERFDVTYFEYIDAGNDAAFAAAVRDAHGMLGANVTVTRALLEPARLMEAISTISVGYDNFDVEYLTERGIVLSHTPDVLTETTADTIFALMLASARRVVELAAFVRAGRVAARHRQRPVRRERECQDRSASSAWGASARRSRAARGSASA